MEMHNNTTTFGLCPASIAWLLRIGSDEGPKEAWESEDGKRFDILSQCLEGRILFDDRILSVLPKILRCVTSELDLPNQKKLADVLFSPQTDISRLKTIKDKSKKLVRASKNEAEHDTAVAIYYAAIANALIYHNERITTFSYKNLSNSYDSLLKKQWLTPEMAELFKFAQDFCKKHLD